VILVEAKHVYHPQFGMGALVKTYMGGYEWEVLFVSGRRFRLPAKEFDGDSVAAVQGDKKAVALAPRRIHLDIELFRARQTLEALRVGIVPVQDAENLTIGLEPEKVTLDRAFARSREASGDVLAVIGDYGYGKSHFIELAARRGLRANFIVAGASLDLVEVPPNKPNKIYEALVTSIRYPDSDQRGLLPLLSKALQDPSAVSRFASLCPREPQTCPLTAALLALQECPSQLALEQTVQWLSGQTKAQTEMKTCLKKPPRLYIGGETARQYSYLLSALSVLATVVGYSGFALLIDESEHYSLLRAAGRERADSFFKAVILSALGLNNGRIRGADIPDHASIAYDISFASEPHLLFLFALTESADRMPVGSWLAPAQIMRLDDRFIEKDIVAFFKMLLRYHGIAYNYYPDRDRYEDFITHAAELLSRALSQHRLNLRELIRAAVSVCDLMFLYADYTPETLLAELKRGLKV